MHTKNPHLKWSILQIFSEMMSNLMLTLRYILNEYDELIWKEVCQLCFLLIFDIDLASLEHIEETSLFFEIHWFLYKFHVVDD